MGVFEDTFFQRLASVCSESRQAFKQHVGMSQLRRQLLTLLSEAGEVSHAALQQQLAVDGATITRLVKQFESEGVLGRRLDPQDNRYTLVSLTVSGQHIVAGLSTAHSLFQTRLLVDIRHSQRRAGDDAARSAMFACQHTRHPERKPEARMNIPSIQKSSRC